MGDGGSLGPAGAAETGAEDAPDRQLVVVPRQPGPLRSLDTVSHAPGDDLDQVIDEVFGPPDNDGPGLFDVGLVVVGAALIAWSWISGGTGPWFAIGIVAVILGIALPARALIQAARERRAAGRRRHAMQAGSVLDLSDPGVGTLAGSYDALQHAAVLPGVTVGREAIDAGHAALLEVASLLGGRPPLTDDERAYVERRTRAIRDLTAQLVKANQAWQRTRLRDDAVDAETVRLRASAVTRAREELESTAGVGAVDELERLRTMLQPGGHDDAAGA